MQIIIFSLFSKTKNTSMNLCFYSEKPLLAQKFRKKQQNAAQSRSLQAGLKNLCFYSKKYSKKTYQIMKNNWFKGTCAYGENA